MIFFSDYQSIYLILPFIGFIIGLFGTMVGGGGGFFFLPVLTLIIGAPAQVAVATSLSATLPICVVGTVAHYRQGNVDLNTGRIFILAGVFGAVAGAAIAGWLSSVQLKTAFGIYVILVAFNVAYSTWRKKQSENNGNQVKSLTTLKRMGRGSFFGFFAGAIAGTFGTSGTAPVMAGLLSMRIPIKIVVGTSLMIVLMNALVAVGAHFLVGQIDMTLVVFLTSGSLLGAVIGTTWFSRARLDHAENKIRYVYVLVMIIIGLLMIMNR